MSESDLETRHRKLALRFGWFVEKITQTGRRGFPDRFYARAKPGVDVCRTCNRGRVVLLEWKDKGESARAQQELRIKQLRAAGVEVHVVDNVVDANRILGI